MTRQRVIGVSETIETLRSAIPENPWVLQCGTVGECLSCSRNVEHCYACRAPHYILAEQDWQRMFPDDPWVPSEHTADCPWLLVQP